MGDGAPVAVLIDGYNLLHAIPRFAPRGSDPTPARERFEAWLAVTAARHRVSECILVWDGPRPGGRGRPPAPLTVVHTPAGVTADERILELCRGRFSARAGSTWIVSSDRGIQVPARALGFEVLGAMTFYRKWGSAAGEGRRGTRKGPHDPDPGAGYHRRPTRAEVDELLDAFLDAEADDET